MSSLLEILYAVLFQKEILCLIILYLPFGNTHILEILM